MIDKHGKEVFTLYVAFKYHNSGNRDLEIGMVSFEEEVVKLFLSQNKDFKYTFIGADEPFPLFEEVRNRK